MNQLEKCEELDKAGLIYWSKNKWRADLDNDTGMAAAGLQDMRQGMGPAHAGETAAMG